jgi:hypothetical protein
VCGDEVESDLLCEPMGSRGARASCPLIPASNRNPSPFRAVSGFSSWLHFNFTALAGCCFQWKKQRRAYPDGSRSASTYKPRICIFEAVLALVVIALTIGGIHAFTSEDATA